MSRELVFWFGNEKIQLKIHNRTNKCDSFFQEFDFCFVNADEKIFLEELGKNITRFRKAQKLTKVQLAFEINTGESAIRRIELGQVNSGAIILNKIALALNVKISDLLEFTNE